jgi:hypothetical protein
MGYPQMVPQPPPKALPAVQQHANDIAIRQLFQVSQPPVSQPHPSQPNQHINLPSLSAQQIQAITSILGQGQNQNVAPQPQTQPWQQQQTVQAPTWPAQNQAQAQPTAPLDILNLADKAAAALRSAIPGHQNLSYPPIHNAQPTVTEKDLSQMVQFALQVSSHLTCLPSLAQLC